jgi:hypothetical protein
MTIIFLAINTARPLTSFLPAQRAPALLSHTAVTPGRSRAAVL